MSRTTKGAKGPGWELWTNIKERQEQQADYQDDPTTALETHIDEVENQLFFVNLELRKLEEEARILSCQVEETRWEKSELETLLNKLQEMSPGAYLQYVAKNPKNI